MRFFDHDIKLPAEKHRGYLLLVFALLSGLIPDMFATDLENYCIIPPVLGGFIVAYWLTASLRRKVSLSLVASCSIFVLRLFTSWAFIGFNAFSHFVTADWISRRAFFILFGCQLIFPLFTLIPLHFLLLLTEKRKVNDA